MLDAADGLSDLDGVADAVLVFEDDVKARNDVTDQILCAKSDGEAGETGNGSDGSNVDAEFLSSGEDGESPDGFAGAAVDDGRQRARLLFAGLSGFALRAGRLDDELGDEPEKAVDEQRSDNDGDQVQEIRDGK